MIGATVNHPNILTIHDTGLHDSTPYLFSDLLEGRSLLIKVTHYRLLDSVVIFQNQLYTIKL